MTLDEAMVLADQLLTGGDHEWGWFQDIVPVLLAEIRGTREG